MRMPPEVFGLALKCSLSWQDLPYTYTFVLRLHSLRILYPNCFHTPITRSHVDDSDSLLLIKLVRKQLLPSRHDSTILLNASKLNRRQFTLELPRESIPLTNNDEKVLSARRDFCIDELGAEFFEDDALIRRDTHVFELLKESTPYIHGESLKVGGCFGVWLVRVLRRSGGGSNCHADY